MQESGTVRISTQAGANLTSEAVLGALLSRMEGCRGAETAAEMRHLVELAPRRAATENHLKRSRAARRQNGAAILRARRALQPSTAKQMGDGQKVFHTSKSPEQRY